MERISNILKQYISERIPQKATNVLFQIFNAVNAVFEHLQYRLDISKRERNILTAQNISSLRSLAAQNGYEPKLRQSSKGILLLKVAPKLYNRVGYPLFVKPYTVFTSKLSKIEYIYISDKTIRLDSNTYYIPVIEGTIVNKQEKGTGEYIQRIYIDTEYVADNSIIIDVAGTKFEEVGSFYNNEGKNNNKQFLVKFSSDPQNPIIIYVKGAEYNDTINITYRLTNGELGNIDVRQEFITDDIVDSYGNNINLSDDEMQIFNVSGFTFGSNGTDENSLRTAIGYNHNINLLFDNISYRNFLSKFSTVLVQDIKVDKEYKQINNIFIWRKHSLNTTESGYDIKKQYQKIIDLKEYILSPTETNELHQIINEFEYCLSSHNIYSPKINKFALQIEFDDIDTLERVKNKLEKCIYDEFSKFLYIRNHYINFETLFDEFKNANECTFEYMLFNQLIEANKIEQKSQLYTPYIVYHTLDGDKDYLLKSITERPIIGTNYIQDDEGPYLPILKGDFSICDSKYNEIELFTDINFVVNDGKTLPNECDCPICVCNKDTE